MPNDLFTLEARFRAGVKKDEPTGVWVSYAPLLQVYSQGENEEEARDALQDAVTLLLRTALERGVFDDVLRGAGLSPVPQGASEGDLEEFIKVQEHALEEQHFEPFEIPVPIPMSFTPRLAVVG